MLLCATRVSWLETVISWKKAIILWCKSVWSAALPLSLCVCIHVCLQHTWMDTSISPADPFAWLDQFTQCLYLKIAYYLLYGGTVSDTSIVMLEIWNSCIFVQVAHSRSLFTVFLHVCKKKFCYIIEFVSVFVFQTR